MTKKIIYKELPDILPIFPLPGVIVLPNGNLPLNIFEPRYISMVEDALGNNRKMIQEDGSTDASSGVQISTINNIKLGGSYNTSIDGAATDLADYPLKFKTNFAIPAQVNLK